MTTKYETALALAQQGFFVFRIKANEKTPARYGWQQEATRDPDQIKSYFDNNADFNIGIFTEKFEHPNFGPMALTVVDVDIKPDKHGDQTMAALDVMGYDIPPTYTVATTSKGYHLYYTHDIPLASGANKLGPHVDLKSAGGYVVGPGSTINGKGYHVISPDEPPAAVPAWLPNRCPPPLPKSLQRDPATLAANDSEQALARGVIDANQTEASAGGRNAAAFKLGCRLRDYGLSEPAAEEILHGWNAANVHPPLDPEEITFAINNVYKYAKLAPGNKSPQSEFEAVPYDPKLDDTPQIKRIYKVNWEDIQAGPNVRPLIRNYLDQDSVSIGYGDSNAGKTFIFIDMAYHIATGKDWAGHKTLKGGVIYLAAEGARSMANRVKALKQAHPDITAVPFALVPCQINLLDSNTDFKAFISLIEEAETDPAIGPVRLIVIDTLNRALAGGNENENTDMGKFIGNLTFIKNRFKCHVLVVHHSGKDTSKGARGHSSLRAAVDTELEIVKTDHMEGTILTRKQRDMDFAPALGFKLNTAAVGTDEDGNPITSCTVSYHDPKLAEDFKMEPRDTVCLQALQSIKNDRKLGEFENVVDEKNWREVCKARNVSTVAGAKPWPKSDASFNKAFYRSRDRLVGFGMVEEVSENQWVILNDE